MRRMTALLLALMLLSGCSTVTDNVANANLFELSPCPPGDYELCAAAGDWPDLVLVEADAVTLADGTVLDRYQPSAEYWQAVDQTYRTYNIYALKSGEILLMEGFSVIPNEAADYDRCDKFADLDESVREKIVAYLDENTPEYDLGSALAESYLEFKRCVAAGEYFDYAAVGRSTCVTATSERLIFISSGNRSDIFDRTDGSHLTADELFCKPWEDVVSYIVDGSRRSADPNMSDELYAELCEKITPEMVQFKAERYNPPLGKDSGGMRVTFVYGELENAALTRGEIYTVHMSHYPSADMYDWAIPIRNLQ